MRHLSFFIFFICGSLLSAQDLYDKDRINEIKIQFEEENWSKELIQLKNKGADERLTATVVLNGKTYEKVGIRYKGNSSFNATTRKGDKKIPFNIKANFINKKQLFDGKYESLKLSNSYRDPSFLREVLAYDIARQYMIAPRANFIKVYVNDTYLGLYHNTESINDDFLKEHFKENKGAFFKCEEVEKTDLKSTCPKGVNSSLAYQGTDTTCYMANYEIKSKMGWSELMKLCRKLEKEEDQVDKYLDIDKTLWALAFNNLFINLDSYIGIVSHNYYIYQTKNKQFTPLIWDMNLTFGGFNRIAAESKSGQKLSEEEMSTLSPALFRKNALVKRPLVAKLLANPLYFKIYIAHYTHMYEEIIKSGYLEERAKALHKIIDSEVKEDLLNLYTYEDFTTNLEQTSTLSKGVNVPGVLGIMKDRQTYLESHSLISAPRPSEVEYAFEEKSENWLITLNGQQSDRAFVFYKDKRKSKGEYVEMERLDSNESSEGVNRFQLQLPKEKAQFVQLIVFNKKQAITLPKKSYFEYIELK